jgi:hypothetical protein
MPMQVDSLISSIMIQAFVTMGVMLVVIVGVIVLVIRMIARSGNAAAAAGRMAQPVSGTLLVTGISMPTENAIYHSARLTGVVSAEGVAATAVTHSGLFRTSKWPRPGQSLPVIVDRANPNLFAIEWDKVDDNAASAMGQAEQIAAAMRQGQDSVMPQAGPKSDYGN